MGMAAAVGGRVGGRAHMVDETECLLRPSDAGR